MLILFLILLQININRSNMKIITKEIKEEGHMYYVKYLEILNVLLPAKLTHKEIEVLAAFMSQEKNLIEDDMFNGVVRKKVMEKLNLKPGGLGNHLKSMIKKKFLDKNEITKKITIKPFLMPEDNVQGFRLKITKV